nr:unnamed protein product [Callosobruchus analis]
MYQQTIRPTG